MLDGIRDGRPGDQRGFIHKKILGGISTIAGVASAFGIPGAGAVSTITRTLAGPRRTVPRTQTARPTRFSEAEKRIGLELKFPEFTTGRRVPPPQFARGDPDFFGGGAGRPAAGPCKDPDLVRNSKGQCVFPGSPFGARTLQGEAVLGIYGAGVRPGSMIIDRAVCGKKMQLGDDGICYNKSQISNKQRMWPAGRRPLLSGGDMRAISIASRAGSRLDRAAARLRKLGMMKKAPVPRKAPAPTQHERVTELHVTK